MDTKIKLTGGYCSVPDLYDRISEALNLPISEKIKYDCTKVEVSQLIMDEVFSYYKEEAHAEQETVSMWWVMFGPKAVEDLEEYEVRVQDGWRKEQE